MPVVEPPGVPAGVGIILTTFGAMVWAQTTVASKRRDKNVRIN
jgi:hypothetical protein